MIAEMRALLVVLACGAICYGGPEILHLGFYHDDWTSLSALHFAQGGLISHMAALARDVSAHIPRPTNIPLYALEHHFFALNPLPWQLALLAVNVLLALAVYEVVARFGVPRRVALTAAVLYLAYPSKDATMFWPGAIICSISLTAFLSSYLAHLEHIRSGSKALRGLAAACLMFSLTTYELAMFLIPIFLLTPASKAPEAAARRRRGFLDAVLVVSVVLAYKFLIVPLFPGVGSAKKLQLSPLHFIWVYLAAGNAIAGPKLMGYTCLSAWKTLIYKPWLAVSALGLCAFLAKREPREMPASNENRRILLLMGAAVVVLGCLPLALSNYSPTPINHQNRINQAFLLGPILMLAAYLGSARARKTEYTALAAAAVFLAAHAAFASVWAEAYRQELRVREAILAHIGDWPADAVLLVLLPERYVAQKAPVFDAHWDITGAVQIWTGDPARRAVTVRPGAPGRPALCSAEGINLGDSVQPYASVRLLDARSSRLTVPGPADCPALLSAP
jgi:hypothetical protein